MWRLHGVTRCACAAVLSALVVLAGCASATKTAPARLPAQTAAAVGTAGGHSAESPASVASAASTPTGGAKLSWVSSVSCADARHCWAGAEAGTSASDGVILATVNGGAAWTVQKTIPGVDAVGPIDCPSTTRCLAVGDTAASGESPLLVTMNGGRTWAEYALPKSLSGPEALDCVNDEDCWGVGIRSPADSDIVMATTNFGRSWVVQNQGSISVSMGVTYGISCPGPADCVIVGIGALTTGNGGATWTRRSLRVAGELNAVACPSLSRCVAEGDGTSGVPENTSTDIATSDDDGQSWDLRVAKVGGRVGDLYSLSCPTPATCLSVGFGWTRLATSAPGSGYVFWGAVERSFDGGRTWTGAAAPEASNLFGVSCATGTPDCIAVGQSEETTGVILRTVDDGSTWTEIPLPKL